MKKFTDVKEAYDGLRRERLSQFKFMVKPTEKGYWGIAVMDDLHEIFSKLSLEKAKRFIDLGSGDGRAVLTAALFTEAAGIECDQELMQISTHMKKRMNIPASFICGDYLEHDLGSYDFLFIHPDNHLDQLETKLLSEMKKDARLVVYSNIYFPETLKKEKELEVNGMKVGVYSTP